MSDIPAGPLAARYIGLVSQDRMFGLWHLGDATDRTFCGRAFCGLPRVIDRSDTYERDWVCATCLVHDSRRARGG